MPLCFQDSSHGVIGAPTSYTAPPCLTAPTHTRASSCRVSTIQINFNQSQVLETQFTGCELLGPHK